MPICQPTERTIHAEDFQNSAYSFTVQSIIDTELIPGPLVVSASAGYSLTTATADQPSAEQALAYHEQAPGRWEASGLVTVVAPDDSFGDGTIVIRDARSETATLPIVASTGGELQTIPTLTVSTSTLVFEPTRSGTPAFQVVRLAQQTSEPVTLTTDAPDYFQLASDSHPIFAPTLTLVPSTTGSYVHVRYQSDRPGSHVGQLFIDQPQQQTTVTLSGHSTGRLPGIVIKQPGLTSHWVIGVFTLLLTSSLAYIGYTNRCSLFPALCPANRIAAPQALVSPGQANPSLDSPETAKSNPATAAVHTPDTHSKRYPTKASADDTPAEQPAQATVRPAVRQSADRRKAGGSAFSQASAKRSRSRPAREPQAEESELERTLNKPDYRQ